MFLQNRDDHKPKVTKQTPGKCSAACIKCPMNGEEIESHLDDVTRAKVIAVNSCIFVFLVAGPNGQNYPNSSKNEKQK